MTAPYFYATKPAIRNHRNVTAIMQAIPHSPPCTPRRVTPSGQHHPRYTPLQPSPDIQPCCFTPRVTPLKRPPIPPMKPSLHLVLRQDSTALEGRQFALPPVPRPEPGLGGVLGGGVRGEKFKKAICSGAEDIFVDGGIVGQVKVYGRQDMAAVRKEMFLIAVKKRLKGEKGNSGKLDT